LRLVAGVDAQDGLAGNTPLAQRLHGLIQVMPHARQDRADGGLTEISGIRPMDSGAWADLYLHMASTQGSTHMRIAEKEVLVTGANRGVGKALVHEALRRGAKRVYAGTRHPLANVDERVTPLPLDVTDAGQIQAAVERVAALDLLINNAGVTAYEDLDRALLDQQLAVNLFGTYEVTQAFLPLVTASRGAILNVLSLAAVAPVPFSPDYSISKAAAFSLSQSLRARLAAQGVSVHVALPGPVDTDMTRGLDIAKASPESVARAIFDGIESGEEEIFPDPFSELLAEGWRVGAVKALERQLAALAQAEPEAA
jgi:NAD(P)-dependent dehydrogenase (short-subunit alcohol dehydrogenase family)